MEQNGFEPNTDFSAMGDFNVEDEYTPPLYAPEGTYHGSVFGVKYDKASNTIIWDVVLNDNGGVLSDGETALDGYHVFYRNWLPNPGDENELNKNGTGTKRQSKINMMKDFSSKMQIDMSTPAKILEALRNAEWTGMDVVVLVTVDEYQGRISNNIKRMSAI